MMTNTKPKVNLQGRYSVREVCTLLGISRETLRRKTLRGIIPVYYRRANMRPYYIGSDIIAYWSRYF